MPQRYITLPLPTGQFIVVHASTDGMPVLLSGAPLAIVRSNIAAPIGIYLWRARAYQSNIFASYREAKAAIAQITAPGYVQPSALNHAPADGARAI